MVNDIRDGPPEEYWDRLRAMMGEGGLMTYWYLGRAFNQHEDPDTMRLRRDMRNASGGILAAHHGHRSGSRRRPPGGSVRSTSRRTSPTPTTCPRCTCCS